MFKKFFCPSKKNVPSSDEAKYPSGELLLSVIQKEYDYELARKSTLETRSGVVLTLSLSILTFVVTNIKMDKLLLLDTSKVMTIIFISFFILTVIISIGSLITSLILLIKVLLTYEYRRLELDDFNEEYGSFQKDIIAMALTKEYKNIVTANQKVNNDKTKFYRFGVYSAISLVISSILLYILSLSL
ncbi:hypothetical protein [Fictibacillus phosphorivorans]|uniref:hypothetical protein n=1 Tax=Fictibacillus phosphorivorans TaxID=1221500 RepID=UPI001293FB83|nr:hypothetical protein [Fictibacillus phosphorivorans]MQR93681.1 hypothetical protein [Fictibacillus phosphorivorans]